MTWYTDDPPSNNVYYRIQIRDDGTWLVCHVQWFDECDYDQSVWLHENGSPVWFATEQDAEDFRHSQKRMERNIRRM